MESTNVETQEPLVHDQTQTQIPFPTGSGRPYRDSTFTFLFLTAILTTFTFGIIAYTRTDTLNMDTKLRLSHVNPITYECEITQQQTPEDPHSTSAIVTLAAIALFTSLALTIPLSLLLVSLLRRYTRPLVFLSAAIAALLPLGIWGLLFSSCLGDPEGCAELVPVSQQLFLLVSLPACSAWLAYEFRKNWTGSAVENGVQALSMATGFLKEHFVLLIVNSVSLVGWMVFVNGPILMFMWYAFNVGEIVPAFDVENDPISKGCCRHYCRAERPGWVYAYVTFASFTALWVYMVTIGTVSHWYIAPTGSATIGNIKRSLRNTYGPSFGTVCYYGTIFHAIVSLVGCLKEILRDEVLNHQSLMLKFAPLFGYIIASISGDSLEESTKKSHNLFLQTSLPIIATTKYPFHSLALQTLGCVTIICSLLQTLVVYVVLGYFSNAVDSETRCLIAIFCIPILLIWQGSLFYVPFSSIFNTVYVCYAMEKHVGEISKPEVCHALLAIPPSLLENGGKVAARQELGI